VGNVGNVKMWEIGKCGKCPNKNACPVMDGWKCNDLFFGRMKSWLMEEIKMFNRKFN
jgi:hypothetical protein